MSEEKDTLMAMIQRECESCRSCELCGGRHNVVFGTGVTDARVMFIGEGPGEQEDLKGSPFVGKAGILLDKMLKAIDLDRKTNIYIANIVKCRPPMNRDPKPEEQDKCIPWLRKQFSVLKPEIVVCLGRIAAQKIITPDIRITKDHGKLYNKGGTVMMPMFHPAAVLRTPSSKADAFEDFLRLQEKKKKKELI